MIFSDSPSQKALERMMTQIKGFPPRGSGVMVLRRFEYTEEMCDCLLCLYYNRKKKCTVSQCPCIEERIIAGAADRSEVMAEIMKNIQNAAFQRRLNQFINESEELHMNFRNEKHKPDFRSKLEQNLLHDQYGSMQEVTDAIKQMLYESGPVKAVFYCPLVGEVTDDEGFSSPVDGRFLKSYAWAVENALEADTADDEMDMAEFFDEDDGVKAKLVSAKWGVETYRGRLFGRIECSLKEELTDAETEILTDWISGQNSDGYGEHFEQQPIDTEDGDLYVSFWNSGDNYSIMTRDELDEYIDNQGMTMGGM